MLRWLLLGAGKLFIDRRAHDYKWCDCHDRRNSGQLNKKNFCLQMIFQSQHKTENHLNKTDNNGGFHFVTVQKSNLVEGGLPDLKIQSNE